MPSNPSREPDLERAEPSLAVPGTFRRARVEVTIPLRDGTLTGALVTGWRKDAAGRWCCYLEWYASPGIGGRGGVYVWDAGRIGVVGDWDEGVVEDSPGVDCAPT